MKGRGCRVCMTLFFFPLISLRILRSFCMLDEERETEGYCMRQMCAWSMEHGTWIGALGVCFFVLSCLYQSR